jgi:hypothetical protein
MSALDPHLPRFAILNAVVGIIARMLSSFMIPSQLQMLTDPRYIRLVVSSTRLRELEVDTLACQTLVDLRVGVEPVVDATALFLVQNDL